MLWKPVTSKVIRPGRVPQTEPRLRLSNSRNGWLNLVSRRWLFDGEYAGWIRWEDTDTGALSIVTAAQGEPGSYPVSRHGHLTVTVVTSRANGATLPVSIRLRPDESEGRRLVLAGLVREDSK